MSTVAATTGPSLCVMTELDNKLTNKNTIMENQLLMWRGIPSSINTIIDIAVNSYQPLREQADYNNTIILIYIV